MSSWDEQYFAEMAESAEQGEFTATGPRLVGEEARRVTEAQFLEWFGTTDPEKLIRQGRPSKERSRDRGKGASPMLRIRVPEEMDRAIQELADSRGKQKSETVRELILAGLRHAD